VKVWEARTGGRLLTKLTQHHKTVTSLCLANNGESLMSASLDRHVKVYDLSSFQVVHTLDYPSSILCVSASPNSKVLAVGMADGLLSVQHWRKRVKIREPPPARGAVHEFNIQHSVMGTGQSDVLVKEERAKKLAVHEVFLKSFNSSKALDSAVMPKTMNKVRHYAPDTVGMAVIQELIRRKFIRGALAGRTALKLRPIVSILKRKMHSQSYTGTVVDVINILLDIYTAELGEDKSLESLFQLLQQHVDWEMDVMTEMMVLKGSIEMVLAANKAKNPPQTISNTGTEMEPDDT
jgi:U3 small nucleolar RNA-associated protein 15